MKVKISVCCAATLALLVLSDATVAQPAPPSSQAGSRPVSEASAAVAKYVARTWEITSSDFALKQLDDKDGLTVFRVTLRPDDSIAPALFRVVEIYVDPRTATVVGERQLR